MLYDPYIAVCGELLPSYAEGIDHERHCPDCNPDYSNDDYREDEIENDE